MLFRSLSRTFTQILDPAFRFVVLKSLLITILIYGLLTTLFVWLRPEAALVDTDSWFSWVNDLLDVGGTLLFVAVLILLFASTASLISTLFLEEIADAVERRYYPGGPAPRKVGLGEAFGVSIKFTVVTLLLNLVVLPLYLVALFFPPLFLIIFYGLNGYLLSREYFELVSLRHLEQNQVSRIRKSNRGAVMVAGVLIAFGTTVPVLNLFVPILATALMLHVFQELRTA